MNKPGFTGPGMTYYGETQSLGKLVRKTYLESPRSIDGLSKKNPWPMDELNMIALCPEMHFSENALCPISDQDFVLSDVFCKKM